jgi:hypothetical protein
LYHDQSDGLEHDSTTLEDESDHDKFDFTKGCENDTNDDEGYVEEHLEVGLGYTKTPAGKEDRNRGGGLVVVSIARSWNRSTDLEHLDKGNTEVKVGQVTADQAQTEEETNGDNGSEVDSTSHLDRLSSIE